MTHDTRGAPGCPVVARRQRHVDADGLSWGMAEELQIEDIVVGTGASAEPGKQVTVHYVGWLVEGGQKFDSSRDRGRPFNFQLGSGDVIKGWDQGVVGMKVGGTRRLTIPQHLAYGRRGYADLIPPRAALCFEVELLKVG
jgi:FKBP-type peptidyl-prolyl cis-trans isomerase